MSSTRPRRYREGLLPEFDEVAGRFTYPCALYEALLKDDRRFPALVWEGHLLDLLNPQSEALAD